MSKIRHKSADEIRNQNLIKKLSIENEGLQAKLEYVAIMTDVDIDTDAQEAQNV